VKLVCEFRRKRRYVALPHLPAACTKSAEPTTVPRHCGARRRCTRPPSWSTVITASMARRVAHFQAQRARNLIRRVDIASKRDELQKGFIGAKQRLFLRRQPQASDASVLSPRTASACNDGNAVSVFQPRSAEQEAPCVCNIPKPMRANDRTSDRRLLASWIMRSLRP